ncbi:DJ-1/PfpI family protein [Natribacillus halophilus]|uniref:DJ-1/PfpI family protein n=1 Tax=Natribacillus halophilus TaxID=549003 RepID=A0A1G8LTI4_9BACI|nr:DJ-1/PfpI family protein [Natribacillus halophilus]
MAFSLFLSISSKVRQLKVSIHHPVDLPGATVKDEEVIVDENLVTSRTPDDLPAFNRESLKLLEK